MLAEGVRPVQSRSAAGRCLQAFSATIVCAAALLAGCSEASLRTLSITPGAGATVLTTQGQTAQFHATGVYQLGSHPPTTTDLTKSATWASSTASVATVDANGVVTAVGTGTSTITATANSSFGLVQGTSTVTVDLTATPYTGLTSISVVPSAQPITVLGQTAKFVAIGAYTGVQPVSQDLTTQVTWSSSAPSVATITNGANGGIATAVSAGTATITASGKSSSGATVIGTATINVTSSNANGLVSISIIPGSQVVYTAGETSQYIAIGTFSGTTPVTQDITNSPNVKWISSDVSVATINSVGLATETGFGTTAITAEWVQTGTPVITGAATFTSQAGGGPVTVPSLSVYKVGNGASTATATITP